MVENLTQMKTIILLASFSIFGMACADPNMKNLEAKLAEAKCRSEFLKSLDNSINTMLLLQQEHKAELEAYQKLQSDSTVSCDSLKNEWRRLTDLPSKY